MNQTWAIGGLIRALAARGARPAVVQAGEGPVIAWSGARLATQAEALALLLITRHGVARGMPVAVQAPNQPTWVAAALAILIAGGVLVPLDDQADTAQVMAALPASGTRLLLTSRAHLEAYKGLLRGTGVKPICLDTLGPDAGEEESSESKRSSGASSVKSPVPDDAAALLATSGTTGTPKIFSLSHRNIGANVQALIDLGIIGAEDRVLLPLPLHHAYPLIVGMLTTLTAGSTLVLPADATGPVIMRAARDGDATVIVGVPRLYDAVVGAIEARLAARPWPVRIITRALLTASSKLQQTTGVPLGRLLFGTARRSIAPSLRLLVSGGARLERSTEQRLQGLGWMVLSGYGLAETASIFTGNRPNYWRAASAGLPLAGGSIRIASPDAEGIGEIQLRGPSVTAGYIDNPEANRASFTEDRWFRTGDLGYLDRDGFLYVTGRAKEILVLGGAKKVDPEALERIYAAAPQIQEIAVLERDGAIVALVRPDRAKLLEMGATNIHDGIRVVLAERARDLLSHERLSGFALTDEPLPRTRLGKYRRFLLPDLYARALSGRLERTPHPPSADDLIPLRNPTGAAIWSLLEGRQPGRLLDLDMNPSLDLNFDSFAWMELTVALQERLGVHLTEDDIASIIQLRDLLRLAIERRSRGEAAEVGPPPIAADFDRWLAPTGLMLTGAGLLLYALNFAVMRGLFRLRVKGLEHLPDEGPIVLTPNHVSDLDAMAIAAAMPL